jgi:ABC-type phosphate transport system substrate-binding protein
MRKLLAGATVLVFGAGAMSNASAQLLMKGSDTLEDVTKGVLADCIVRTANPAILQTSDITYVGGGSGGGQAALIAGQQRIAPMSRPLNGAGCPVTPPATTPAINPFGEQLLIGLDGIAVIAANQGHRDSLFDDGIGATFTCGDAIVSTVLPYSLITPLPRPVPETCPLETDPASPIVGLPNCCINPANGDRQGCNADGSYTFRDWKDVLALLYGGQNKTTAAALLGTASKTRNPLRINCASQVRKALADNWGALFDTDCAAGASATNCRKLKHAFRRGDLSGTTDTFVTLAALAVAVPAFTTTFLPLPTGIPTVNPATATANPFCNAGASAMNKGDSDYLDLDPIRRISDSANTTRLGLEQVSEGYGALSNAPAGGAPPAGTGAIGNDLRPDPTLASALVELPELGAPNRQNVGPNAAITAPAPNDFITLQRAAIAQRKGLGLVLPIEIPTNYADEGVAYWSPTSAPGQAPLICNPGVFAPTIPVAPAGLCPDGTSPPCLFPVNVTAGVVSFNCLVATATPVKPPLRDNRIYNLLVVNAAGKYVLDGYLNPNLTALNAARQNRVVSAYFRLHTSQTTNYGGNPTLLGTAGTSVCKALTSTDQIGCLVKANPCSIGFAGREGVDKAPLILNTMAYRLGTTLADSRPPTNTTINALVDPSPTAAFYPMARKLFVNHWTDPSLTPPFAAKEEVLYSCFKDSTITNPRIQQFNFLPVPVTGPIVDNICPNNRP